MTAVLSVRRLKMNFGATEVIRGVDMEVQKSEIHALIGPNGAGKSTLFNLLSGGLQPSAGEIRLFDQPISGLTPENIQQRGLSRSFQVSNVFGRMPVFENIRCACFRKENDGYVFWRSASRSKRANARAEEVLELVGLQDARDMVAGSLPYAGQRALEIAMTIACDAPVVLLDEPTAGMSNTETEHAIALIRRIAANRTLMIVEHDMSVVFGLSDRISVLVYGQIIATGTPAEIRANPQVQEAYLGREVG
ncbi:MAG: ABC transporter ATP-binding protein [Rhodanobacteraceae bacterium]